MRLWRSAEGATSGSEVRNTAVPGTRVGCDFFSIETSWSTLTLGWIAGLLEIVGGGLVLVGFWTRATAFVLSGQMAVAYFMAHAPGSFFPLLNGGDAAILFCFIFFYIVFAGPGAWSLDAARSRR